MSQVAAPYVARTHWKIDLPGISGLRSTVSLDAVIPGAESQLQSYVCNGHFSQPHQ